VISYVLVNESTRTDPELGGELTPSILDSIATALLWQLSGDFAQEWGGGYAVRADIAANVQAGEIIVHIQDALSVPDAAGYHDDSATGLAEVFISRVGSISLTEGAESLSVTLSHELCEASANPAANRWADRGDGNEECLEACDRVEDRFYASPNGVSVSDFLRQSAFDPGAKGPYSRLDSLPNALAMTVGGYALVRSVASDEHQATPCKPRIVGNPRAARVAKLYHPSSRAYRSGLR
jgi:hypothetical protein